jgi:hypothetical protein
VILKEYLNIVRYKALEKEATKIIREIKAKKGKKNKLREFIIH